MADTGQRERDDAFLVGLVTVLFIPNAMNGGVLLHRVGKRQQNFADCIVRRYAGLALSRSQRLLS